jgi:hypothetical protein
MGKGPIECYKNNTFTFASRTLLEEQIARCSVFAIFILTNKAKKQVNPKLVDEQLV